MAEWATVVLAISSAIAMIVLAWRRFSLYGLHRQSDRRLLLADLVLIVASLEILLDAIADSLPCGTVPGLLHAAALVTRGAFAAGAFTLVVTFPADERRERQIREQVITNRRRLMK